MKGPGAGAHKDNLVTAADRLCSVHHNFQPAQYHCSNALCIFKTIPLFRYFVHTAGSPPVPPPIVYLSPKLGPQKRILPNQTKTLQATASMCLYTKYKYKCGHSYTSAPKMCDRWYDHKTCKTKKDKVKYETCCDTNGCRDCRGCYRCDQWSRSRSSRR